MLDLALSHGSWCTIETPIELCPLPSMLELGGEPGKVIVYDQARLVLPIVVVPAKISTVLALADVVNDLLGQRVFRAKQGDS